MCCGSPRLLSELVGPEQGEPASGGAVCTPQEPFCRGMMFTAFFALSVSGSKVSLNVMSTLNNFYGSWRQR